MSLSSKNKIRVVKFQSGFFSSELFADIFNTDLGKYDTPIQLIYLDNYLKRLSVKTLVIESHYIDRHFIHEFQNYYSTCLIPPVNYCFRIHAFDVKFTVRKLNASLKNNDFKKDRFFDKSYIGFIIIRPVSYAPVGRVMIPKLQDQPERMIKAVFNKTIHLLGIELKVEGLPFMQQDRRVSACATVAIWS